MPGGAEHLTGSPGAVRWAGWCFSRGLILNSHVSEDGDTSSSWSQPAALGEQQKWR